jgi:hypothetical protein
MRVGAYNPQKHNNASWGYVANLYIFWSSYSGTQYNIKIYILFYIKFSDVP